MRKTFSMLVLAVAVLSVLAWSFAVASDGPDKTKPGEKQSLYKAAGTPRYSVLNINNLTTWHRSDGQSNHAPSGDNGMYYPRGTGNVIYQDGIVFGGRVFVGGFPGAGGTAAAVQPIRVGGGTYGIGTREGWVTGSGATAVAVSPADARARIYRIRRDYANMSEAEARADAASYNEVTVPEVTDAQVAAMLAQYDKDWKEWPVDLGAPYIDRNRNGRYDPPPAFSATFTVDSLISQNRDEPGLAGADPNSPADQVLWTVYNDLDRTQALGFVGSEPIGLEIQKTVWGYKRADALGNLYFTRYKIINKGGVDIGGGQKGAFHIDEMYVCQWSDPDLGSFSDDLVGCDTLLSMGFVYNANAVDATFRKFGIPVPAGGYDFLAGPIVPAPGQNAIFDLKVRPNFRNLGMSSFAYFSAGSPYSDPPGGAANYSTGTGRWYKMLRGFAPLGTITDPDVPYASGPFPVSKFPLSGDPVARTGFLDGLGTTYSFAPGDRRILLNTGPFRMAPGDTQEIVVGVVAGLGADRLSSVAVMKFNDRFVQNTYNAIFQVPKPPVAPDVKVAELDGQIVLEWGSNFTRVADIETRISQPGAYRFEGYNVYQLPSRGSRLSEAKRIVTFDLATDPSVVLDEQFDVKSGQILNVPVQFGSNSGIQRYFVVKRDYVRDIDKLYNGQEYYFAVTAYAVSTVPGFLPTALESDPVVLTVRPKSPPLGTRYSAKALDKASVKVAQGVTDVDLPVLIIDPTRLRSTTYSLSFRTVTGGMEWILRDKNAGTTLFTSRNLGSVVSGNPGDDTDYPIINGIQPIVLQIDPVIRADSTRWIPAKPPQLGGGRYTGGPPAHPSANITTGADLGRTYLGQFSSSYDMAALKRVEIRFGPGRGQKAYRVRRTGPGTEYLIQTGVIPGVAPNGEGFVPIPFSAWEVGGPGGTGGRQLTISWRDQDNNGKWNPPVGGDGVEVIFIHNRTYDPNGTQYTYPTNPDPAKRGPAILNETTVGPGADIMYGLSFFSVGTQISGDDGSVSAGTLYIRPVFALNSGVVFEFSTTAPTYNAELAVQDAAAKIGVFPNPYYAYNAAETNRFFRFVTFNNLPRKATFRIFNLAGQLVRTLEKDDASQFFRWDLNNQAQFPVASGIYIVHIDMPELGTTKVLKVAIIQEQEVLDTY